MGVELSLLFNNGKKSKKKGGRGKATSGDSSGVKIDIGVVNFVEGFRIFTEGIRNLGEAYTTVENGRVHRAEMQRNGQAMRNVIPEVKALVSNLATYVKHRNIHELFFTFLQGANTVAYWVDVLQGDKAQAEIGKLIHGELEAHVGLEAPRKFARQVHMTIKEQMASTPAGDAHDIFFLYHPDTNWHGEFLHIVKRHPLPANFLGMSENLDAIVIWMLFLRRQLGDKLKKARFHLVIPAYRPMLVKDPLIFPQALYPLTIRGLVHNSKPLVWFDLPTIDGVPPHLLELHHIGNLASPPSAWRLPVAGATAAVAGAAGLAVAGTATAVAAPVIGPLAAAVWLAGGASAVHGALKAGAAVEQLFDRPAPRLIGRRHGRGEAVPREGDDEADDFRVQPDMRKVSRHPRHGHRRRGGRQDRRD